MKTNTSYNNSKHVFMVYLWFHSTQMQFINQDCVFYFIFLFVLSITTWTGNILMPLKDIRLTRRQSSKVNCSPNSDMKEISLLTLYLQILRDSKGNSDIGSCWENHKGRFGSLLVNCSCNRWLLYLGSLWWRNYPATSSLLLPLG